MRSHPLYYDDTDDSKILQQWHMCHSNRYAYVSHGNGPKAGTPLTIIVAYEFGMGLRPAPDGAGPVVSVRWGWQPFFRNSISFELVKTLVVTDASRTTFRVLHGV